MLYQNRTVYSDKKNNAKMMCATACTTTIILNECDTDQVKKNVKGSDDDAHFDVTEYINFYQVNWKVLTDLKSINFYNISYDVLNILFETKKSQM